jgi:RhtB (resistance to homoserine/threonine) family protein
MSSSFWLMLAGLAGLNLLGAASPGPAFFVVSRSAAGQSRRAGLATALGVSTATVIWAFAAIHGLALLIAEAAWLFRFMQALGGAYLVYLGWQAFRHAPEPLPKVDPATGPIDGPAAYRRGFMVNMTNPKVMVFFGSVFASVYAPGMPEWTNLAVLAVIAIDEIAWYSVVALAFSTRPAQAAYGRAKRWIDRAFGTLLALFGLRLLWSQRAFAI